MVQETTKHLFHANSEKFFREKLLSFHETCKTKMIMCGVGPKDCDIQTIKMAPLFHDYKYCERVMGGMLHHKPNIHVALFDEDNNNDFEMMITHLFDESKHNNMDVTGTYLYQVAHGYPDDSNCLYQFWKLNDNTDLSSINSLWNES